MDIPTPEERVLHSTRSDVQIVAEPSRLRVRVINENGRPVPGVTVYFRCAEMSGSNTLDADARIDIYVEVGTRYEVRAQLGNAATEWKEVRTSRDSLDVDVALVLRSDAGGTDAIPPEPAR